MGQSTPYSKRNFRSFLWHAVFLAFAQNFMDVDTVIPAMLVELGGTAMQVGILTAIMLGGSSFTQLFFAPFINNRKFKKPWLLMGINSRVLSILSLGIMLYYLSSHQPGNIIWLIFLFITIFALGGAFANISYMDILGKTVNQDDRKKFFSTKQIFTGTVILLSAISARNVLQLADFPVNYAYMFFIGGVALLVASGGFWNLKEEQPSGSKIKGVRHFLQVMKQELKTNPKLLYFLGFINTQGVAVSFLPFIMLYAKEIFKSESSDTGSFLLFKIVGVVLISLFVLFLSKKVKYRNLLNINAALSIVMVILIFFIDDLSHIRYIFILGGIVYSLYSITMNGVLLEISGHENRALYTGFAGAGNILPALFPILGGKIIESFGFHVFFGVFVLIIASAFFFIFKTNCTK